MDSRSQSINVPTLEELGRQVFENLCLCYLDINPGKTQQDFLDEVWNPVCFSDTSDSGELLDRLNKIPGSEFTSHPGHRPILIAVSFCGLTLNALRANTREQAWYSMAQACYWQGVAFASKGIEYARQNTIVATRKNTAAKGGNSRAANQQIIKDEAFRLARELRPTEGWPSRSQAVKGIQDAVSKFAKEKKRPLTVSHGPKTIDKWLSTMTDASILFRSKKNNAPAFDK